MSIRQEKVGNLIKREVSIIFQQNGTKLAPGAMVSVTIVRMSPDLGMAHCYLSIFAPGDKGDILKGIESARGEIRHTLGKKVRHQLRIVPDLRFHLDDSLDYAEKIDDLLKS